MKRRTFTFPVGYEPFHRKELYNFQLNRWYAFGYLRGEDMREAGRRIRSFATWKAELLRQADRAAAEGRDINAALSVRAAEFYVRAGDADKNVLYRKFVELFDAAFAADGFKRHRIPYDGAFLPAMQVPAAGTSKGTIVMHGGFDSLIEEFYSMMCYFSDHGYDVIGFEGPGQGAALRTYDLPLTLEWEKPLSAVLDFFRVNTVTLLGLSMGGWLCLRASAFEPRVAKVIADGHAIDYMKSMPPLLRRIHVWCMEHIRGFTNRMARLKFEHRDGMAPWMVDHLQFITKRHEPLDALEFFMELSEENMHADRITQHVLLLSGAADHFVPVKMHAMQLRALVSARSVSEHVFTEREHADHHCQIGNVNLALETMVDWMESITP